MTANINHKSGNFPLDENIKTASAHNEKLMSVADQISSNITRSIVSAPAALLRDAKPIKYVFVPLEPEVQVQPGSAKPIKYVFVPLPPPAAKPEADDPSNGERTKITEQEHMAIRKEMGKVKTVYVDERIRSDNNDYPVSREVIKNEELMLIVFTTLNSELIEANVRLWEKAGHTHSFHHILAKYL